MGVRPMVTSALSKTLVIGAVPVFEMMMRSMAAGWSIARANVEGKWFQGDFMAGKDFIQAPGFQAGFKTKTEKRIHTPCYGGVRGRFAISGIRVGLVVMTRDVVSLSSWECTHNSNSTVKMSS